MILLDLPGRPSTALLARTYRLDRELVARIDGLAEANKLFASDLVRYLLRYALDQVDAGRLPVPTTPALNVLVEPGSWPGQM
jgi:hypothetical protein